MLIATHREEPELGFCMARRLLARYFISPRKLGLYTQDQRDHLATTFPKHNTLVWCRDNHHLLVAGPVKNNKGDIIARPFWLVIGTRPFATMMAPCDYPAELSDGPVTLTLPEALWAYHHYLSLRDKTALSRLYYTLSVSQAEDNQSVHSYLTGDNSGLYEKIADDYIMGTFRPVGWRL